LLIALVAGAVGLKVHEPKMHSFSALTPAHLEQLHADPLMAGLAIAELRNGSALYPRGVEPGRQVVFATNPVTFVKEDRTTRHLFFKINSFTFCSLDKHSGSTPNDRSRMMFGGRRIVHLIVHYVGPELRGIIPYGCDMRALSLPRGGVFGSLPRLAMVFDKKQGCCARDLWFAFLEPTYTEVLLRWSGSEGTQANWVPFVHDGMFHVIQRCANSPPWPLRHTWIM